jgi:hypothetical protein
MEWIDLPQDGYQRVALINCNEPSSSMRFWEILE